MIELLVRASGLLLSDEEGQTMVEYALILVLVSIAGITFLAAIGQFPSGVFSQINADL